MFTRSAMIFGLICTGHMAQAACPMAPDHTGALAVLMDKARAAPNEAVARQINQEMWQLWSDAPDEPAQEMLDRGMSKRSGYDFLGALSDFDRLVDYCPQFAEGYNQRAFVHFLREDFSAAVVDLNRALELSPDHVAARSGLALSLMNMGDLDAAREQLQAALALNPWLPERHLAAKGAPLGPKGDDI